MAFKFERLSGESRHRNASEILREEAQALLHNCHARDEMRLLGPVGLLWAEPGHRHIEALR